MKRLLVIVIAAALVCSGSAFAALVSSSSAVSTLVADSADLVAQGYVPVQLAVDAVARDSAGSVTSRLTSGSWRIIADSDDRGQDVDMQVCDGSTTLGADSSAKKRAQVDLEITGTRTVTVKPRAYTVKSGYGDLFLVVIIARRERTTEAQVEQLAEITGGFLALLAAEEASGYQTVHAEADAFPSVDAGKRMQRTMVAGNDYQIAAAGLHGVERLALRVLRPDGRGVPPQTLASVAMASFTASSTGTHTIDVVPILTDEAGVFGLVVGYRR